MNFNQLASKIAKAEGKKSQARIGDIREILALIGDEIYARPEIVEHFYLSGLIRAKQKEKKAKKK